MLLVYVMDSPLGLASWSWHWSPGPPAETQSSTLPGKTWWFNHCHSTPTHSLFLSFCVSSQSATLPTQGPHKFALVHPWFLLQLQRLSFPFLCTSCLDYSTSLNERLGRPQFWWCLTLRQRNIRETRFFLPGLVVDRLCLLWIELATETMARMTRPRSIFSVVIHQDRPNVVMVIEGEGGRCVRRRWLFWVLPGRAWILVKER